VAARNPQRLAEPGGRLDRYRGALAVEEGVPALVEGAERIRPCDNLCAQRLGRAAGSRADEDSMGHVLMVKRPHGSVKRRETREEVTAQLQPGPPAVRQTSQCPWRTAAGSS
jgi:hypothetical protein